MSDSSRSGYFKLAKQSGGIGCYAEAEVAVSCGSSASGPAITWEDEALPWRDGEFGHGARRGIDMALAAYPAPVSEVRILKLRVMLVDSTADSVAYAACFAVWDALQVCSCDPPRWEGGKFYFPEIP